MTTKEIFVNEVSRLWSELKDRDDTIFENVGIQIDAPRLFDELKANNHDFHMSLVQENSLYDKKRKIAKHFWDHIVGDLYESTILGMRESGLLEEALDSFEKSYKIEKTAELILENGIFASFTTGKKKELTSSILEMAFYPSTFYENNRSFLDQDEFLEEAWASPTLQWGGDRIRDIARLTKNVYVFMVYALVSPVSLLMSTSSRAADSVLTAYDGRAPSGTDPSLRKFYSFIDELSPINFIFKFLNKDLYDISNLLKKTNNLEDEYIQEVLKEMKVDPNKMVMKCWEKNKHQLRGGDTSQGKIVDLFKNFFSGKGLANFLRNPFYNNETQITALLKDDASDTNYQKMFFDFRTCVYEKLFEIILGYAKSIYSMDDTSYEIIKAANDAHKSKNFKAFFDIRPKQVNEEAMFKIMRTLVSIDSIATTLEKRKGELVADKYIDKFTDFLRQNVKQVYGELDEMANQRKYNESRYDEDQPDDEAKAKAIQQERFDAKKSIFAN